MLLRILKEFILPRLALRMAVRAKKSSIIDWMWTKSNPWFRAAGKTNYAIVTVDVTQIRNSLKEHGEVGLCGGYARPVTRDTLTKFCRKMNAASWIETRFRKAVDMESDSAST